MARKKNYAVEHAFPHAGRWYTRENQAEVAKLPEQLIQQLLETGSIREEKHPPTPRSSARTSPPPRAAAAGLPVDDTPSVPRPADLQPEDDA